jgi:hypothetical protein
LATWTRVARSPWLPTLAAIVTLPLLLRGLDLDGFFGGDPGVRYTAALEAEAHPLRPFEVDAPTVGGVAEPAFMEWQFRPHGNHAHALVAPLFPILIAPLIALMGPPGAYIVPAVSLVLLLPVMAALAGRLQVRGPRSLAGWATLLLSPLLFYALECWDHTPAILAIATAWLLLLPDDAGRSRPIAAGLAMACAVLLRPEAVWSGMALGAAMLASPARRRAGLVFGLSIVLALLPIGCIYAVHFGSPWGPHVVANAELMQQSWLATRIDIARAWLFTWQGRDSLWAAFPVAVLALAAPPVTPLTRTLWLLVAVPLAAAILSAPSVGGAQWGPRYALGIVPPLLLLAQHASVGLLQNRGAIRWVAAAVIAVAVIAGLATTRLAYRTMRGSKRLHAEIARAMGAPFEQYVVTDLFWLDQLAATTSPRPTFLYVRDRKALDRLVTILRARGVRRFVAVRGAESAAPIWVVDWEGGYRLAGERRVAVRDLRLRTYVLP